jgi:hypothetical protein
MSTKRKRQNEEYEDPDEAACVRTTLSGEPDTRGKNPRQGFSKPETAFLAQQYEKFQAIMSMRKEVCKHVHLEHSKVASSNGFPARTVESIESKLTRMLEDQDVKLLPSCAYWLNDAGRVVSSKRAVAAAFATVGSAGRNVRAAGVMRHEKDTCADDGDESQSEEVEAVQVSRPSKKARVAEAPAPSIPVEPLPTPLALHGYNLDAFFAPRYVFDSNALEAFAVISVPPGFSMDLQKSPPNVIATMIDQPLDPSNFAHLGPTFVVLQEALRDGRALRANYMADERFYRRVYEPPPQLKGRKLTVDIETLVRVEGSDILHHYAVIK